MILRVRIPIPYLATASYIGFIVLLNVLMVKLHGVAAFGQTVSPADAFVGFIYIVRDFAQREVKHYIFVAMLIGAVLSYGLADRQIALASMSGFLIGELIDWAIYTFTKRPLSRRLLLSAGISAPFDSVVFLGVAGRLGWLPVVIMTVGKLMGVYLLWCVWKLRIRYIHQHPQRQVSEIS